MRVRNLTKVYAEPGGGSVVAHAGIEFDLYPGEVLGIVGESGSGKSTLVRVLYFDADATAGEVYFRPVDGGATNVLGLSSRRKRHIRNHLMGMVYQNPRDGLNFRFSAGGNVAEKLVLADLLDVGRIRRRAGELLSQTEVAIERMDESPVFFSGGMQQRVQIAKAIANNPPLVFLDEITSGLDLSVQAKVLDLIRSLQQEHGVSMIVVSHDMGVIRMLTDRTIVMKQGRVVEHGLTDQILQDPQHGYTQLLVSSLL